MPDVRLIDANALINVLHAKLCRIDNGRTMRQAAIPVADGMRIMELEYCIGLIQCADIIDAVPDTLALIQQLEAQVPRWISVEERLPEAGRRVAFIPSCNQESVYVGVLANIGKSGGVMFSHREGRHKSNYYAKYWMPLPEPPEESP